MKPYPFFPTAFVGGLVCTCILVAVAQDYSESSKFTGTDQPLNEETTRILGGVSDGTRAPEQPKPEPIDFNVIKSHSHPVHVKLSPEMPGLPAPEGMMNLTVELVQKPVLVEAPPLTQVEAEAAASTLTERLEEPTKEQPKVQMLFVSASVYDKSATQFHIQSSGDQNKSVSGWSNINFHHFSGFTSYQVKGEDGTLRHYTLMMAVSDVADPSVKIPTLPNLATNGPTFVVTDGDTRIPPDKQLAEDLHSLYKIEGKRLAEAAEDRTKAYEERKAYLLANPPKPKDVTVRFWNRETVNPR